MQNPRDFALERWFARWEFSAPHLVSCSDCEPFTVAELLAIAGAPAEAILDLRLGYRESQGDPALREKIARFHPGLGPDDILVTNAPAEAIFLLMSALLAPGDRVVVQTPCYQSLFELPRSRGCEVVAWPLVETEDGWRADLERLDAALVGAKLLVINAPHNPTGWLPSAAEMDEIARLAFARGAYLFCDEMYRGLERRVEDRLIPAASRGERGISLWGASKSFALPGLRIGWLALRDRALLDAMVRLKDYTSICATAPGELLAGVALDAAEAIFARNLAIIVESTAAARAFAGPGWRAPRAGSVALVRLPGGSAEAFCEDAARRLGVVLVPSTMFDFGDSHVRLGLGRKGFSEGMRILGAAR